MRRGFVVAVMLAMMLGLRALQVDGVGGTNPLTLATIGFVVLAAFASAELGGSLSLPKVTGYILGGIALGPYAGNIMSIASAFSAITAAVTATISANVSGGCRAGVVSVVITVPLRRRGANGNRSAIENSPRSLLCRRSYEGDAQ